MRVRAGFLFSRMMPVSSWQKRQEPNAGKTSVSKQAVLSFEVFTSRGNESARFKDFQFFKDKSRNAVWIGTGFWKPANVSSLNRAPGER